MADVLQYNSRRSPVLAMHGMVASSQSLASEVGHRILRQGGNAVDAAVAMAATLNVTQPCSTGIGGDCFMLLYKADEKKVHGLNGSGRSPQALTLDYVKAQGFEEALPPFSIHTVTVPGAAAAWADAVEMFGSMPLSEVLHPAIQLADEGFPVAPVAAHQWAEGVAQFQLWPDNAQDMLIDGRAPVAGDVMKMPNLAETFRQLASKGKDGFYKGPIAQAITSTVQRHGGVLTMADLAAHTTAVVTPITANYKGVDVYEIPPNGQAGVPQGLTALIALKILEGLPMADLPHNSPQYLHYLIEALRLAFADTRKFVSDPDHVSTHANAGCCDGSTDTPCPAVKRLLSDEYIAARRAIISADTARADVQAGRPFDSGDTVYFCVVDPQGNACSFINSNYMGFGTGLVPPGCGFTLQNRGANFSLDPRHPNCLAGGKRPFHTIIPAMALKDGRLWAAFGVMGGFMQPQGHVQVLLNMIDHGMDPQAAIDAARVCLQDGHAGSDVALEEGIPASTIDALKRMGQRCHVAPLVAHARSLFGNSQIIRLAHNGVLWGGSDPRIDGMAIGF